jgi:hypothetical protein
MFRVPDHGFLWAGVHDFQRARDAQGLRALHQPLPGLRLLRRIRRPLLDVRRKRRKPQQDEHPKVAGASRDAAERVRAEMRQGQEVARRAQAAE